MKYLSIGLIVLGLLVGVFALNMEITAEGSNIVNLSLLSMRQNFLMIGGILFIAGIILIASVQRNKVQEKDSIIKSEGSPLVSSGSSILSRYWKVKSVGDRVILISVIAALVSLTMNWGIIYVDNIDYSHGSKASLLNIVAILIIWFYPLVMTIKNKPMRFINGLLAGVISLIWIAREIFISNTVNSQINGVKTENITFLLGNGVYMALAASLLLLAGLAIKIRTVLKNNSAQQSDQ